jgi:hypothetical protein
MATRAKKEPKGYWAIVGNGSYGLWFGRVLASDEKILREGGLRLYGARNIRYWYGRRGGITSLAASGLCGPDRGKSVIGETIESTLLRDVHAVHRCSEEAAKTLIDWVTP